MVFLVFLLRLVPVNHASKLRYYASGDISQWILKTEKRKWFLYYLSIIRTSIAIILWLITFTPLERAGPLILMWLLLIMLLGHQPWCHDCCLRYHHCFCSNYTTITTIFVTLGLHNSWHHGSYCCHLSHHYHYYYYLWILLKWLVIIA